MSRYTTDAPSACRSRQPSTHICEQSGATVWQGSVPLCPGTALEAEMGSQSHEMGSHVAAKQWGSQLEVMLTAATTLPAVQGTRICTTEQLQSRAAAAAPAGTSASCPGRLPPPAASRGLKEFDCTKLEFKTAGIRQPVALCNCGASSRRRQRSSGSKYKMHWQARRAHPPPSHCRRAARPAGQNPVDPDRCAGAAAWQPRLAAGPPPGQEVEGL